MMGHKLQPLSEREKKYAEDHHGLVYHFLHKYGYSIEEYYDIAILGYLKAVQLYHIREDLRNKVQFSTVGYLNMRSEIKDYFKALNSQKRKPVKEIISLDAVYAEGEGFYNIIGGKTTEADVLERMILENILERFPEKQRNIIMLKMDGYNDREVYSLLDIPSSTYQYTMRKIKSAVNELIKNSTDTLKIHSEYCRKRKGD